MIRNAELTDLEAIRALLVAANHTPYDVSRVVTEKCFAPGYAGPATTKVYEESGEIVGVSVLSHCFLRMLAVRPDRRRRGIGSALLHDAGKQAKVIAAEPGNYFTPGVLLRDEETLRFFRARDYIDTRWTDNLVADLAPLTNGNGVFRPRQKDRDRFLDFVNRQFGKIWRFEAAKAFEADPPTAFFAEDHGSIAGFAVHDVNNRGLGFFGPMGVSKPLRKHGYGRELLLASLVDLRRLGYSTAVIPWTDSIDFYRKSCNAEPSERFMVLVRS